MSDKTKIEWTDATWNPVVGCSVISPGCKHCYAMRLAGTRLRHHPSRAGLTIDTEAGPVWTGEVRLIEEWLDQPLRWRRPRRIFVCAHGDLFHEDVPDEWIDRVFAVMALAPQHIFQVLTKRPERMRRYMVDDAAPHRIARAMDVMDQDIGPEEVRPVVGYPGYFVSSHGFVYAEKRGRRLRLRPDASDQGHLRVPLYRHGDKGYERLLVHRLVLEAFVGPAPSPETQGRHRDGYPGNNAITNLTWGSQDTNWDDSKRHGTHRRYAKLTSEQAKQIKRRFIRGETAEALGREFEISDTQARNIGMGKQWAVEAPIPWPLSQTWLGVSVEDQRRADERIPHLLATPAAVRFISAEPLLSPINLCQLNDDGSMATDALSGIRVRTDRDGEPVDVAESLARLDWVIVGGESGPRARPMHPDWARALRDQCRVAKVSFFFKQWGEWVTENQSPENIVLPSEARMPWCGPWNDDGPTGDQTSVYRVGKARAGRLLDGVEHSEFPEVRR